MCLLLPLIFLKKKRARVISLKYESNHGTIYSNPQCLSISLPIKAKAHTMTYKATYKLPDLAPLTLLSLLQPLYTRQFFKHTSKLPTEDPCTGCALCLAGTPRQMAPCLTLGFPSKDSPSHAFSDSSLTATCYFPFLLPFCFSVLIPFSCIIYVTNISCLSHLAH